MQLDFFRYWQETMAYKNGFNLLSKQLDGQLATLHLPALREELTVCCPGTRRLHGFFIPS